MSKDIFKNSPQCLATGCTLHIAAEDKWVNGDLLKCSDALIFKAGYTIKDGRCKTAWVMPYDKAKEKPQQNTKQLMLPCSDIIVDWQGTLVFSKNAAEFNEALIAYLARVALKL